MLFVNIAIALSPKYVQLNHWHPIANTISYFFQCNHVFGELFLPVTNTNGGVRYDDSHLSVLHHGGAVLCKAGCGSVHGPPSGTSHRELTDGHTVD